MFAIHEDLSIYLTRGDSASITFPITHSFNADDIVRFQVFGKKDCANLLLRKDFTVESATETLTITLDGSETKLIPIINKPTDLWYEVEVNPGEMSETIIGYDADGAKVLTLFPEGSDDIASYEDFVVSAYSIAVEHGYEGSKEEWLASLKGADGDKGDDGVSPVINVSKSGKVTTITITDASGTKTATINDGEDGDKGDDGVDGRGIVSIKRTSGNGAAGTTDTYTITYTDNTTSTFNVYNGANGSGGSGSGESGATFTPYVDADGNLSWTNNKGLANPDTVNIKGAKGDKGDKGDAGDRGTSGVYVGSGTIPSGYNVKIDPNGSADELYTKTEVDNAIAAAISGAMEGSY